MQDDSRAAVGLVAEWAEAYLGALDGLPVRRPEADEVTARFSGPLPAQGDGALEAVRALLEEGVEASISSAGPRCFHFVTGGVTPAALAAEWLASTLDQNGFAWVESPLAGQLEVVSLGWLKELFGLPADWGGVLTSGATTANFTALAAARQWWGESHGRDVAAEGTAGLPPMPVLSSGYVHPSARKALAMLGAGRDSVKTFVRDGAGRVDLPALAAALSDLGGEAAVVIGNAGEVNAGDFDPIGALADLAEEHGAWLHVDGAFGLFARATPRAAALAEGVERARSVIADGHKWLNVPYDCGFAFVRDPALLGQVFSLSAAYLPDPADPQPNFGNLGPEASRRARSLAVWATLRAYGRAGYQALVERHLDIAQHLARRVDEAPDLERLADVPLNIVCFRFCPAGAPESELDELNTRLGEEVLADGRVYVGTTRYEGRIAFRPAIVNWRTRPEDVDLLVEVIRELGARLVTKSAV